MPDHYQQLLDYRNLNTGQKIWFHKRAEYDDRVKRALSHFPTEWDTFRKAYHYAFLNNSKDPLRCVVCDIELKWKSGYSRTKVCGGTCRNLNPSTQALYQAACVERFGTPFASQSTQFREQVKNTNLEKYGVENPMQSAEIRESYNQAMIAKYGVDNLFKDPSYIQEKVQERFGVDHMMHLPEVLDASFKATRRFKDYIFKTGEVVKVQGVEPDALAILESYGYQFSDLIVENGKTPVIFHSYAGKRRRYYCDIFVPKENKIIEVKSDYTYNADYELNIAKQQACLDAGYDFEFWVFKGKHKELEIIKQESI